MDADIENFIQHLERRNRSPGTLNHYRFAIKRCMDVLEERNVGFDPHTAGEKEISEIIKGMEIKDSTMKNYVNIFGSYLQYVQGRNPVREMGILWNRDAVNRRFIDIDDLSKLMSSADPDTKLILVLGAFMGLRRKEIASIRIGDIGLDSIRVKGKGHGRNGLTARQPMTLYVSREILSYMEWRQRTYVTDDDHLLLLPDKHGNPAHAEDRLTTISSKVVRLGKSLGIELSCHSLRRLYCTSLVESGCPLGTIKELMRHSDVNTTIECYIRPSGLRLNEWSDICARRMLSALEPDVSGGSGCEGHGSDPTAPGAEEIGIGGIQKAWMRP